MLTDHVIYHTILLLHIHPLIVVSYDLMSNILNIY